MKTQCAFVAVVLAVAFSAVQSQSEDLGACVTKMTETMQPMMSGSMTDVNEMKSKMCPILKDFFRCGLKASSENRPTEDQLNQLKQAMQSSSQAFTQQLDCEINFDQIVDEVWSSATSARPFSILATIMVAFLALFLSAKKL